MEITNVLETSFKKITDKIVKERPKVPKGLKEKPVFPVAEIHKKLCEDQDLKSVDPQVPIYLATVEEYVTHEILELAGNHAMMRGSNAIEELDITTVIREDQDLNALLGEFINDQQQPPPPPE